MGRSFRRNNDSRYNDDYDAYSRAEKEYREHKKEKRLNAALKTKRIDLLVDEDDYGDYD